MDVLTWWSLAMFSGALAMALVITPGPPLVMRQAAGAAAMLGALLSLIAAREFAGRPRHAMRAASGVVVWIVANQFPFVANNQPVWLCLSWGMAALYTFAVALALRPDGVEELPARPAMLVFMVAHGAAYAAHAIAVPLGLEGGFVGLITGILVLEGQFRTIGIAFLVLTLTKQRAELAAARNLETARDASEARRRFVAHMSHEVRTPLNGVFGVAQILARDTRLLPDQREQVAALESAGRHLLAIVNDALDMAKIDAGRLDAILQPFDLLSVAADCIALVRPVALDRRIKLLNLPGASIPGLILGDRTRLQQILLNLLSNALKFTPAGGSVTLCSAIATGGVRFDVVDTGQGVPVDQRHLLFQDFSQLDPAMAQGAGLGLAISARLATHLGGSLQYLPGNDGVGSIFRLTLPWSETRAPADEVAPAPAGPESPSVETRLHLLLADDVRGNRMVLRAMLAVDGHMVVEARDGAEALGIIMRDRFDALLLDLRMPRMDGLELTKRLRAMPGWTQTVPIIGISADAMPETVQSCLDGGMDIVLAKPVDRDVLLAELRRRVPRPEVASSAAD